MVGRILWSWPGRFRLFWKPPVTSNPLMWIDMGTALAVRVFGLVLHVYRRTPEAGHIFRYPSKDKDYIIGVDPAEPE